LNYLGKGLSINGVFNREGNLVCELYIDTGDGDVNRTVFEALRDRRAELERGIGHELEWQELEGRRACRVKLECPGLVRDLDQHPKLIDWLMTNHLTFRRVLRPVVDALDEVVWMKHDAIPQ
jgi:hypothetical protein